MKRLAVFILLVLLLCGMDCFFKKDWNINSFFLNSDVEIYLSDIKNLSGENYIKNGEGAILFCKYEKVENYLSLDNVVGLTIKIYNVQEKDVLQNLNPTKVYNSMGYTYGFTSKVYDFGSVNGNNFQMASGDNFVLVGFPVLLGSY